MVFFQKYPILGCLVILFILLLAWSYWGTYSPVVTPYRVSDPKIPKAFHGMRIVQVSDLHNMQFGKNNDKLLALVKQAQPDLIVITGDMFDSRRTNVSVSIAFGKACAKLAPTYYVPGNHESRLPEEYAALKAGLIEVGVTVLENENVSLQRGDAAVTLTGLMDPNFCEPVEVLPSLISENYQIVLSHRPELLSLYAQYGLDLVFTGHAHGGQFRLPLIGGFFAPHQGLFPKYTTGIYREGETAMVVSRGMGNPPFPPRFNNRPELVVVTLESV